MRQITIIILGVLLSATAALAAEGREHEVHERGHVTLHVVLEGKLLVMELEAPGMDIVGFEHSPRNTMDEGKIKKALESLENAAGLFALSAQPDCSISGAVAEYDVIKNDGREDSGHSAFHARYEWQCSELDALDQIGLQIFERFPRIEEIDAIIFDLNGQTAQELAADSTKIRL
jgi:hypothetical protein